jgi:hypothetical protein
MEDGSKPNPDPAFIEKLIDAHEKRKAFIREYMRKYRVEHRADVNAYKRALYKRQKEAKLAQQKE